MGQNGSSQSEGGREKPPLSKQATAFIDIGTGNGSMLFALRKEGWNGEMVGVDYSPASVALARRIGVQLDERRADGDASSSDSSADSEEEPVAMGELASFSSVKFEEWDIMTASPSSGWMREGGFDVVLDKGTFDAISLSSETTSEGERVFESYPSKVVKLVKKGGLVLITSCNWTEEELTQWFTSELELERVGEVKYPSFRFGGRTGQSVCSVCFRRR